MGIFFIQIQEFFGSFSQWVLDNTPLAIFMVFIGLATLYFIRRSANQATKSLRELEKVNALAAKNEAEALIKDQIKEFVFIMEIRDDALMPTSRINENTEIEFGALNAIAQAYFQKYSGFIKATNEYEEASQELLLSYTLKASEDVMFKTRLANAKRYRKTFDRLQLILNDPWPPHARN